MVARWLWDHLLLASALMALVVLGLVGALALGWNSPRPGGSPDWEAQALPTCYDVPPDRPVVELLGPKAGDFAFEMLLLPTTVPESRLLDYGLVYRAQDQDNHYAFLVGADGYYAVVKVEDGREAFLVDWQQFPHIRRGTERNRILVTCAGDACSFRINDEYAVTVEDDRWESGRLGIEARSPEDRAVIALQRADLWLRE